jgi:hypothetical protein
MGTSPNAMRRSLHILMLCTSFGCAPQKPAQWAEGGAQLLLAEAVWTRPGISSLELLAGGRLLLEGETEFSLDARGRVTDSEGDPLALLSADGQLFTSDNEYAGRVGVQNASPPWSSVAWLRVESDGNVLWFDEAGNAHRAGRWSGCEGEQLRTCTLITHLYLLASTRARNATVSAPIHHFPYPYYYPGFTFGMGYW